MKSDEKDDMSGIHELFEEFGLKLKNNPTSEELRFLLEKFIEETRFTLAYLNEYGAITKVALTELFGALVMLIKSENEKTANVQGTIQKALDLLKAIHMNTELSPEQVVAYREDVFRIIDEARSEAAESRQFNREIFYVACYVGGGVVLTTIGVGVWMLTKGQSSGMLAKGGQMAMKGIDAAKSVWHAKKVIGK